MNAEASQEFIYVAMTCLVMERLVGACGFFNLHQVMQLTSHFVSYDLLCLPLQHPIGRPLE